MLTGTQVQDIMKTIFLACEGPEFTDSSAGCSRTRRILSRLGYPENTHAMLRQPCGSWLVTLQLDGWLVIIHDEMVAHRLYVPLNPDSPPTVFCPAC